MMASSHPRASLETALANGILLLSGNPEAAADQAREILSKDPENRPALRLLGRALRRLGHQAEAEEAELAAIKAASNEPALVGGAQAIRAGDLPKADQLVRAYHERHPDDPAAMRLLAELAAKAGLMKEAERLLRSALDHAPRYTSARLKLANVLHAQNDFRGSIEELDKLVGDESAEGSARLSKAATLVLVGEFKQAADLYRQLIDKVPDKPELWISYAHVLNTLGRADESVAAYRRAIALKPVDGEAWWSIANLKSARLNDGDIAAMLSTLDRPELLHKARIQLHFALGKAFEDAGDYARAFDHYAAGNRIKSEDVGYNSEIIHQLVLRSEATFDQAFFDAREGAGAEDRDPIFVIGMPRAGSTLVEQILASHSMIEGTAELPYMRGIRAQLSPAGERAYPESLREVPAAELRALGKRYLEMASENRKTKRPYFIDKLPNNWESLGLILTILPNARIVDARRHPMACCFSNFKQLYARGHEFSYALETAGRFYVDYVRMLDHFDRLFPGRIHRVIHERLVDEPDAEIRRLLDYVGVPFEESCLRFHENERPVRTPSAEQVRQPINRKGLEQWRHFAPWLGELEQVLGEVLTCYPAVPDDLAV